MATHPSRSRLVSMFAVVAVAVTLALVTGCGRRDAAAGGHDHSDHDHDQDHDHGPAPAMAAGHHGHAHVAPHGGTVVVLGDEAFHLEFVRDAEVGRLTAYVLDAELENFVRIGAETLEVSAAVGGEAVTLALRAAANPVTGETVGDTAQFEAEAPWIKNAPEFDAVLRSITVRGRTYTDVKFRFPDGHDAH